MEDILERHRDTWEKKKILRIIYEEWYNKIKSDLSKSEGKTVELGSGTGNFKEFMPEIISSDVDPCDWLDMSFDAHKMPFGNESLSNIVMTDVFHHLYNPVLFLSEAYRVLKPGGRIIMVEPFPSPVSIIVYKLFHPEPFIFSTDYFSKNDLQNKDPWDSNQAIPYLIFFKHIRLFEIEFKNKFNILKKEKFSFVLYPASGGFENKQLIPDSMIPLFQKTENLLYPFRDLLAFRCYIVIEKI